MSINFFWELTTDIFFQNNNELEIATSHFYRCCFMKRRSSTSFERHVGTDSTKMKLNVQLPKTIIQEKCLWLFNATLPYTKRPHIFSNNKNQKFQHIGRFSLQFVSGTVDRKKKELIPPVIWKKHSKYWKCEDHHHLKNSIHSHEVKKSHKDFEKSTLAISQNNR